MLTAAQEKLIREFNLNCKKLFALQEQDQKRKETWLTGHQVNKLVTVNLLTLRRKKQVETRTAATGGLEYLLESIPHNFKKQAS